MSTDVLTAQRNELLRWMQHRRKAARILAVLAAVAFGTAWPGWRDHNPRAFLISLAIGVVLTVGSLCFLLMYLALAANEAQLEPDPSPRKYGFRAAFYLAIGVGGIALDLHNFLRNLAWLPFRCGLHTHAQCTFVRADSPLGFWVSHVFYLCVLLYMVQFGMKSAAQWWRLRHAQ